MAYIRIWICIIDYVTMFG